MLAGKALKMMVQDVVDVQEIGGILQWPCFPLSVS